MEDTFYIAKVDGKLDTKINLTKGNLIQAFTTGRFKYFEVGDVNIYCVNLKDCTVNEVPMEEIQETIKMNKEKRKEWKKKQENKAIEQEIERLKKELHY